MADGPKKFGRYFLLDLLAQGGMAEIYRARLASSDGAGRIIVIKRIQSGYGANNEFLQMFKSEIKVTMGFSHPNIVQLYDFGDEQDQPYIAMEWVDGKNLRQFLTRFVELKQKFPIDLAVQIIEQAACGLHYAHNFKDKISGASLNIVHRDISPQNLIISYEGTVKVIDFGIAKATVNSEATRAGVIKGKPSYLSPEQINGDVLDGRSDLFSLATVLWELLAGRKLFSGENDLAVLKMIESCNTYVKPPSTINPDVPPELDYIVLKALAKQRDKRYQSVEEFQRVLHKFLYSHAPDFNPGDLAYYAKDMFKNEIVDDRKKIQRLNDEVEHLLANVPSSKVGRDLELDEIDILEGSEEADDTVVSTKPKQNFALFENSDVSEASLDLTGHAPQRTKASPSGVPATPQASGTALPPAASSRGKISVIQPEPQRKPTPREESRREQREQVRKTEQKAERQATNRGFITFAGIAVAVLGIAFFMGKDVLPNPGQLLSMFKSGDSFRRPASGSSSPETSAEEAPQPAPRSKNILLKLNFLPGSGTTIQVGGIEVNPENPTIRVPLDKPIEIAIDRKGYKHYFNQIFIDSSKVGNLAEWVEEIPLEPNHYGTLYISTTPSAEATITVDGRFWVKNTPFDKDVMLPVGTYTVEMVNKGLGMGKKMSVVIEENKAIRLEERLEINDK